MATDLRLHRIVAVQPYPLKEAERAHLSFFRSADNPVRFGIDQPPKADRIVRAPITMVPGAGKS